MTVKQLLDLFHKGMYQPGGNIRHDMNIYFRDTKGELKDLEVNDIAVCDDEVILIGSVAEGKG